MYEVGRICEAVGGVLPHQLLNAEISDYHLDREVLSLYLELKRRGGAKGSTERYYQELKRRHEEMMREDVSANN